jgi:hypothetical protein
LPFPSVLATSALLASSSSSVVLSSSSKLSVTLLRKTLRLGADSKVVDKAKRATEPETPGSVLWPKNRSTDEAFVAAAPDDEEAKAEARFR